MIDEKVRLVGPPTGDPGGVAVYLECEPEDVQEMVVLGRQMAITKAREAGHQVNAIADELGPVPVNRHTAQQLLIGKTNSPESTAAIKQASDAKILVYRKKFILTFVG